MPDSGALTIQGTGAPELEEVLEVPLVLEKAEVVPELDDVEALLELDAAEAEITEEEEAAAEPDEVAPTAVDAREPVEPELEVLAAEGPVLDAEEVEALDVELAEELRPLASVLVPGIGHSPCREISTREVLEAFVWISSSALSDPVAGGP